MIILFPFLATSRSMSSRSRRRNDFPDAINIICSVNYPLLSQYHLFKPLFLKMNQGLPLGEVAISQHPKRQPRNTLRPKYTRQI